MKRRLAIAALVSSVFAGILTAPLPDAWFVETSQRRVVDRHDQTLAERAHPGEGRVQWRELHEVSPAVLAAVVAAEDKRFWRHHGVDPRAIARAMIADVRAGSVVQGGSTISMQTARLLAGRGPGLRGKAVEAWRAIRLDAALSKEEILTWYLNRASFAPGTVGLDAAARQTFDEDAGSLSLAEAAALVASLPAPSKLHPRVNAAANRRARARVLKRMELLGLATPEAVELALAETMQLRRPVPPSDATHLVAHALDQRSNPSITTTIDVGLQREVEAIARRALQGLSDHSVDHAAVVVVHAPTREVRAWVGSGDWHAEDGQNDGVRALRSPGSTLKPFLYAIALEQGWLETAMLSDVPARWSTTHGSWAPENYDRSFHGPVSLRQALATSSNVTAARLLEQVGTETFLSRLRAMELPLNNHSRSYGLGLALGGGEVSLLQLTAAYATLANEGLYAPLHWDRGAPMAPPVRIFDAMAAWQTTDILSDPVARSPAFGRHSVLDRSYPVAVKTGTSTAFRDNWTVGYTSEWVVGVWVGNFDGRPMVNISGVTGAGPIWAEVMDVATRGHARRPTAPEDLQRATHCALSGQLAGPHCTHTIDAMHPGDATLPQTCDWHSSCGVRWPGELVQWAQDEGLDTSCDHPSLRARIAWPPNGAVFYVDPRNPAEHQQLTLRANVPGQGSVDWRINGEALAIDGTVAMWTPRRRGSNSIELSVDGNLVDRVNVHIGGIQSTAADTR